MSSDEPLAGHEFSLEVAGTDPLRFRVIGMNDVDVLKELEEDLNREVCVNTARSGTARVVAFTDGRNNVPVPVPVSVMPTPGQGVVTVRWLLAALCDAEQKLRQFAAHRVYGAVPDVLNVDFAGLNWCFERKAYRARWTCTS